jgi:hypothetical protein
LESSLIRYVIMYGVDDVVVLLMVRTVACRQMP